MKTNLASAVEPSGGGDDLVRDLVRQAMVARERAHAPYSRFPVGAALRARSGRVYTGCNIENASSGLTVCAERVAVWKAVAEGERDFQALAVVSASGATPCGACRQVLSEFAVDLEVVVADTEGLIWRTTLAALLPAPFPRESAAEAMRREGAPSARL